MQTDAAGPRTTLSALLNYAQLVQTNNFYYQRLTIYYLEAAMGTIIILMTGCCS